MEGDISRLDSQKSTKISIHSLRMEGDGVVAQAFRDSGTFQSTPSAWRETGYCKFAVGTKSISIHSLRMEGDDIKSENSKYSSSFQSTPSAWRETVPAALVAVSLAFQSTPSAWRETICGGQTKTVRRISIHSLRMEGDFPALSTGTATKHFNPLPPHGGRLRCNAFAVASLIFQSTPSAWRETGVPRSGLVPMGISIHSLRMEGDPHRHRQGSRSAISIHSLRMEGDRISDPVRCPVFHFNPLPPHGGRPSPFGSLPFLVHISIHSLRMEGDVSREAGVVVVSLAFQSTPSAWRETFLR